MKRKLVSLITAAAVAITTLFCCTVTASAETTKFDILKEIKKISIAEDAKLESTMCGYFGLTSGGYTVFVSGLDNDKAAETAALLATEDYGLEAVIVLDTGVGIGCTSKVHTAYIEKEDFAHDDAVKSGELAQVGTKYKLTVNVTSYISTNLKKAKKAAVSIRAVNAKTGEKSYYGGKKLYYIPFSDKDTSKTPVSDLTISKIGNMTYSGGAQKPVPIIKEGSYTLQKGKDFTLSYENNVKVGTAKVIIKGKGSYKGTRRISFKIIPATTKIKTASGSYDKATVYWEKVNGAETCHVYARDSYGGDYKEVASAPVSDGKVTFKCPLGMVLFLKVRTSCNVDGKDYFSKYSKELLFSNALSW